MPNEGIARAKEHLCHASGLGERRPVWNLHSQQPPVAGSQEGVYEEFEQAVADNVRKLKLGGGMDPQTTLGPLIAPGALERVSQF